MSTGRRTSRRLALLLAGLLVLSPGCRSLGQLGYDGYAWSNDVFASNPVSVVPYFVGLALGVIAGLPLTLISGPLALVGYPAEDRDEFFNSSAFLPSLSLGTFVGSVLAAPFYPFGLPFVPDPPQVAEAAGE